MEATRLHHAYAAIVYLYMSLDARDVSTHSLGDRAVGHWTLLSPHGIMDATSKWVQLLAAEAWPQMDRRVWG